MNPINLSTVAELSNDDLVAKVKHLVGREREVTAVLIAHLAELDERRLYLGEGCSSLFTYCTQVLRFSENAAYGRIQAARTAQRFPVILEMLSNGSVNLTTLGLVAPHLTSDNYREVLDMARHKSKRQVAELVAALSPKPAVPDSVRRLPTVSHVPSSPGASPDAQANPEPASGSQAAPSSGLLYSTVVTPPDPAVVAPLAPQRYKVQFTASAEVYEKLRVAQDLLRHQIPNGDLGTIFDRALTTLLEALAKQRFAAADRPRGSRGAAPTTRHIPAEVKRVSGCATGGGAPS